VTIVTPISYAKNIKLGEESLKTAVFKSKRGNLCSKIEIRTPAQIKVKHIEAYVAHRLEEGLSLRSLQNEMAAIRSVLIESGREQFVNQDRLSNKNLGLSGASRQGTKTAITNEKYTTVLAAAMERDEGVAAGIQLARELGLRAEEAVQATKSLPTWAKHLNQGKSTIRVIFGTKGGRPRDVTIFPENRNAVVSAVNFALEISNKQNGNLINKPNLKKAMDRFHNESRTLGLKGKESPHSLRYAFAQDQLARYELHDYSRKEALAAVSCDLGHGDGRGWYIEHVYTK
jgi:integrase